MWGPERPCSDQVSQQFPTVADQVLFLVDGFGFGALESTSQSWFEDKNLYSTSVYARFMCFRVVLRLGCFSRSICSCF